MIEVVVSMVLLGIVFAGSVPAVVWVVRTQRALERRQSAILAASNLLDLLTVRPWTDLPPGDLPDLTLPAEVALDFPALRVQGTVVEESAPTARRVTVTISWEEAVGKPNRPVTLSGWVFPRRMEGS